MNTKIGILKLNEIPTAAIQVQKWVCPDGDEDNSIFNDGNQVFEGKYRFVNVDDISVSAIISYKKMLLQTPFWKEHKNLFNNDKVQIVRVFAPFSYLAQYINPYTLYAVDLEDTLLDKILQEIYIQIKQYIVNLARYKNVVFSISDPAVDITFCGMEYFKRFSGCYVHRLLKETEEFMDKNLTYICGRLSHALLSQGFIRTYEYLDIEEYIHDGEKKDFEAVLFEMTEMKEIKFVGEMCIHELTRICRIY